MSAVRATALRAGGACVRCRKGKTKCVYENGRAPCKNCAKGMHDCYLPADSVTRGAHGVSPARTLQRVRDALPSDRPGPAAHAHAHAHAHADRHPHATTHPQALQAAAVRLRTQVPLNEKVSPDMLEHCERVVNKVLPACVAFHRPSFIQQLRSQSVDSVMINALLCMAARHSPLLIQRFGKEQGPSQAAESFGLKASNYIWLALDAPTLADIQALCLMVIHEWGSRSAVRAYIYLGQAARMAQMYRVVHANRHHADPTHFLPEESFRRTLWLIYILDCFLTSSPGRHPALSQLDIKDVALPCEDQNFNFGNPVWVRTLDGTAPRGCTAAALGPVGEFGHIVLATQAWRMVVEMMTTATLETFSEEQCQTLEAKVSQVQANLPHHFAERAGQMDVHITMGNGLTFAMIHMLLHCATIFINRRRVLQVVTSDGFTVEGWPLSPQNHIQTVQHILDSSHSIISMLAALQRATEPNMVCSLPIFMLFSGFTAGSTVAYLALKGLSPPQTHDSINKMVDRCLSLMKEGSDSWNLVVPWFRHLGVMRRVLQDANFGEDAEDHAGEDLMQAQRSPSLKDDSMSQSDAPHESMDYEHTPTHGLSIEEMQATLQPTAHEARSSTPQGTSQPAPPAPMDSRSSEPPRPRPAGVTTINGHSMTHVTPAAASPPTGSDQDVKVESPEPASNGSNAGAVSNESAAVGKDGDEKVDNMTPTELCAAFERQLLELDDLAAFMGGGV